jgi:hypothetical protein
MNNHARASKIYKRLSSVSFVIGVSLIIAFNDVGDSSLETGLFVAGLVSLPLSALLFLINSLHRDYIDAEQRRSPRFLTLPDWVLQKFAERRSGGVKKPSQFRHATESTPDSNDRSSGD